MENLTCAAPGACAESSATPVSTQRPCEALAKQGSTLGPGTLRRSSVLRRSDEELCRVPFVVLRSFSEAERSRAAVITFNLRTPKASHEICLSASLAKVAHCKVISETVH